MRSSASVLAREHARLSAVFGSLLVASLAGYAACSTKSGDVELGQPDGSAGVDGGTVDGGHDAAPGDPCAPTTYSPTPPDQCGDYERYPCGLPQGLGAMRGDCIFSVNDCNALCPDVHFNCNVPLGYCVDGGVVPDDAGGVVVDCSTCPGNAGRAPYGFRPSFAREARSEIGAYFAALAHLEAASVFAFRTLREDLEAWNAPCELAFAARRAEKDEVRHTRAMGRLARRFGSRHTRPTVEPTPARAFVDIVIENLVEGCVRETFGALVATWQAAHAPDQAIRDAFSAIAKDETDHAALAWAVARWALPKLDAGERARALESYEAAVMELVTQGATETSALAVAVGLPNAHERARLVARIARELFADLESARELAA